MGEPIRVLHYGPVVGAGGIGTFVINLYREIDKDKVQFDFMQHAEPEGNDLKIAEEISEMGGRIFPVPKIREYPVKARRMMERVILNSGIDILHCDITLLTQLITQKIAYKAGIPIIVHSHSAGRFFGKSFFYNILHRNISAAADNITYYTHKVNMKKISKYDCKYFACSNAAGVAMFGKKAVDEGLVTVLPNAIQAESFIYNPIKAREMKSRLGLTGKFIIGHVGRFEFEKNHEFLLEIFHAIKKKKGDSALILVGDGINKSSVERKAVQLGLQDSVLFMCNRSDVPDILQAMDIFMLPSHYEGLPLVLIEAQASGLPCIISDAVSKQSKILSESQFISLQRPAEFWAEEVLKCASTYGRRNTYDEICKAGYDAKESAAKMADYYCALVKTDRK